MAYRSGSDFGFKGIVVMGKIRLRLRVRLRLRLRLRLRFM